MHFCRWLALAALTAAVTLSARSGLAQVKPKILIIFDTSGTMLRSSVRGEIGAQCRTNGQCDTGLTCSDPAHPDYADCRPADGRLGTDGSALCSPQEALGQKTRIYQLKRALFEVLQGMGAREVDFALATYPQLVDPTREPKCPNQCLVTAFDPNSPCAGHYYTTADTLSEFASLQKCGPTNYDWCAYGCKLTTHNPNTQQNGNCGDASNPCSAWYPRLAQEVLKVPFGVAPEQIMYYFDGVEDTDHTAPLDNPELRAAFSWWTPLGKSLFYAHGYFDKDVVPNIPASQATCQRMAVALFTDGIESCNSTEGDPFYPTTWAANLHALGVDVHTVAIDVAASGSGYTLLQQIPQSGGGSFQSVSGNTSALKQAFLNIIAAAQPPTEKCNGADDDCDGEKDEDFPVGQPCDNKLLGVCYKTGVYVCDGETGVRCNAETPSGTDEICDGLDNNCDGTADEGLACCIPQPEICNNKDDNCNTLIDDGIPELDCGKAVGECTQGKTKCENGQLTCSGGKGPMNEECDGKDNDCDGKRDGMSEPCYDKPQGCTYNAETKTWDCNGRCKAGYKTCTAQENSGEWSGVWGECRGQEGPLDELCNNFDDDCDGDIDEDAECPSGSKCIGGQCVLPCAHTEFGCPRGFRCIDDWCVKDTCDIDSCHAKGWICHEGKCEDPCIGVPPCPGKYEKCIFGSCEDTSCFNTKYACQSGKVCVEGKCETDPCANADCGTDEFCAEGTCVKVCAALGCGLDESCTIVEVNGRPSNTCVKDPCAQIACDPGYVCVDGSCELDPCMQKRCDTGQICVNNECVADPCIGIQCPRGFICRGAGQCIADKVLATREIYTAGGGGCSIGPQGQPTNSAQLLLLLAACALFIVYRQSRRD